MSKETNKRLPVTAISVLYFRQYPVLLFFGSYVSTVTFSCVNLLLKIKSGKMSVTALKWTLLCFC